MNANMNTILAKLNLISEERALGHQLRRLGMGAVKLLKGPQQAARSMIEGMAEISAAVDEETASWLEPDAIAGGASGPFDVFDLRVWLVLAEAAGVPFVPARQILSLTERELEAIDRKLSMPEPVSRRIADGLRRAFPEITDIDRTSSEPVDPEAVWNRLFDAMDDVPNGWIVRSHLCGPSLLKAMAGAGTVVDGNSAAEFDKGLEVGAGWVRLGNRRRVDATDKRFVDTFARGHRPTIHYLARPWVKAARSMEGPDPHRHGSVFAGRGRWPAEWRVYVERGEVTGCSLYYPWVGTATALNARMALEAMELAKRIVSEAQRRNLVPRFMDVELARRGVDKAKADPSWLDLLARFPRDGIACTLDFIEVDGQGLTLLEGGPGNTPIGGGHPCGFAGVDMREGVPGPKATTGVALKLMDHVLLGDPKTWRDGDHGGRILSIEEARYLAAS